jgi:arylsulfatase A-like enzyme
MKSKIDRRGFLKLLGLLPLSGFASHLKPSQFLKSDANRKPNILIIVFDAFSSHNISLYGYPRKTTPNLDRLASRATVYHNHYSAGNFTTPGTASILTGTYPWTHRALQINSEVQEKYQTRNIFHLFNDYHRFSYSHNPLVSILQNQFSNDLDLYKLREELTLGENKWLPMVFRSDEDAATVSWSRATLKSEQDFSTLLFLPYLFNYIKEHRNKQMENVFPLGLPISSLDNYLLEDAIDWLLSEVPNIPQPFLGYIHLLPPHAPYNTRSEFIDAFRNQELPYKKKAKHPLARTGRIKLQHGMDYYRQTYDEFILYVDFEFDRLYSSLDKIGILDNTLLILTSDHGEMFERGIMGHTTPSLHDPILRTPLVIFNPGQKARKDIYTKSSAVDILPTVLHLTGKPVPSWIEGIILPPYNPILEERSIFALEAKTNNPSRPLKSASAMILKDQYKLTNYFGYKYLPRGADITELYDIDSDPEELTDLSSKHPSIVADLSAELMSLIEKADAPYR